MLVSIIIPTYNRASLITRAVSSIIKQSYINWELIIVDDGSTDNTEAELQKYLYDNRIKYVKKENTGATATRNFGVDKANGEIITFLDSDDEAANTWLAKMITPFSNQNVAVTCCGCSYHDYTGRIIKTALPRKLGPTFLNYTGKFTNGGVFALKREAFLAIGGYDVSLKSSQNTELALRLTPYLQAKNLRIQNLSELLIKVHIHNGPRIRYNHAGVFEGSTQVLKKHIDRFKLDQNLYRNWLRTIMYNGIELNRYKDLLPFVKLLLKVARLDYKSWYYLIKWSTIYSKKHYMDK